MKNVFRKRKKIKVINSLTNTFSIYNSITECSKHFNCSETTIKNYCLKKYKPNNDLIFEFFD